MVFVQKYTKFDAFKMTINCTAITSDILLNISEYLCTPGEKLALAAVSRWFYAVLKYTPYVYPILSQKFNLDSLLARLPGNEELCTKIQHLDIIYPSRFDPNAFKCENHHKRTLHATGDKIAMQKINIVLKLATQLKSLRVYNLFSASHVAWLEPLIACMRGSYTFTLKSLLIARPITGTLRFVQSQNLLSELAIFSDAAGFDPPPESDAPPPQPPTISLPYLCSLWATPWWSCAILLQSPVRRFGLLHDNSSEDERRTCRRVIKSLVNIGGHPTVECLALTHEDFFWDHQTVSLNQYGQAFPNATKLYIILPGVGNGRF
ncbi:hypothetical protein FRC12_005459, partial [Ceratobasidium sp. 428]